MVVLLIWVACSVSLAIVFASESDVVWTLVFAAATAIGLCMWACLQRAQSESERFIAWLNEHRDQIIAGPIRYEDQVVSIDDTVSRFDVCVSAVFATATYHSAYRLVDDPARPGINLLCTSCTLLMGWWGLPWGPIQTINSLCQNLAGGRRCRVGDLIAVDETEGLPEPDGTA